LEKKFMFANCARAPYHNRYLQVGSQLQEAGTGALAAISRQHEASMERHIVLGVVDLSPKAAAAASGETASPTPRKPTNQRAKLSDVYSSVPFPASFSPPQARALTAEPQKRRPKHGFVSYEPTKKGF
jgi:hypothetical protein